MNNHVQHVIIIPAAAAAAAKRSLWNTLFALCSSVHIYIYTLEQRVNKVFHIYTCWGVPIATLKVTILVVGC